MVVIKFQGSLPGAQGGRNPPVMGCVLGEPRSALPDIVFNHANSKPRSDIFCLPFGPDCHLHMRRLRHLRMPTSLVHARTSATSLVHAHTFLLCYAVFIGILLRIWGFGFRVLGVSGFGVSGWGRDDIHFA